MFASRALALYVAKLERRGFLSSEDRAALMSLPSICKQFSAGDVIIEAEAPATHCVLVEAGFVSRVKTLKRGDRQIVAFHIPGDAVDMQSILFLKTDHSIEAHCETRTIFIAHEDILALTKRSDPIAKALWLDTLADASIFREWTANIGRRRADRRIAHLFLELATRFDAIGTLLDATFPLPAKQSALADALGLSLVHFNKSLQGLRRAGFVSTKHSVTIENWAKLVELSGFDSEYLHLGSARIKTAADLTTVA